MERTRAKEEQFRKRMSEYRFLMEVADPKRGLRRAGAVSAGRHTADGKK